MKLLNILQITNHLKYSISNKKCSAITLFIFSRVSSYIFTYRRLENDDIN